MSRGAGAIAAIDGNASARRQTLAKKAHALAVRRDRMRAAMTRGALSGDPVHEQDGGAGGGGYHPPPQRGPARPSWLTNLTRATLKPSPTRIPSATPPVKRTGPSLRLPNLWQPQRKAPPPPFPGAPAPTTTTSTVTPTMTTSSGGGAAITDGSAIPGVDPSVDPYMDDGTAPDDGTTATTAAPSGPSGKKVLAIAAGIGALIWLLGRKKG